jgi:hypothetical protein
MLIQKSNHLNYLHNIDLPIKLIYFLSMPNQFFLIYPKNPSFSSFLGDGSEIKNFVLVFFILLVPSF